MTRSRRQAPTRVRRARGVALMAVLYFLVLAALTSIAAVYGTRLASRQSAGARTDAMLIAAADAILYQAVTHWNGAQHVRQAVGSTTIDSVPVSTRIHGTLSVTRLAMRVFSLVADVRSLRSGPARRVSLVVRIPLPAPALPAALLSAVDVSIGDGARITADTGLCADTSAPAVIAAPGVTVTVDSALANPPTVRVDSSALDSARYLRLGGDTWDSLVARADVVLDGDAHVTPAPVVSSGACVEDATNWGAPADSASPCSSRAPLVYARGDLTIDGGAGQGVLLVDGRLVIAGPFTYSGQIVVRRGLETRADAISISGVLYAWRATSDSTRARASRADVVLTHGVSLRSSRCDAAHGMQSWLQPRALHSRAWSEVF